MQWITDQYLINHRYPSSYQYQCQINFISCQYQRRRRKAGSVMCSQFSCIRWCGLRGSGRKRSSSVGHVAAALCGPAAMTDGIDGGTKCFVAFISRFFYNRTAVILLVCGCGEGVDGSTQTLMYWRCNGERRCWHTQTGRFCDRI